MVKGVDIVPWNCHICQGDFDTPGGGLCARCNQPTCRSHLHRLEVKRKGSRKSEYVEGLVCTPCIGEGEQIIGRVERAIKLL